MNEKMSSSSGSLFSVLHTKDYALDHFIEQVDISERFLNLAGNLGRSADKKSSWTLRALLTTSLVNSTNGIAGDDIRHQFILNFSSIIFFGEIFGRFVFR